MKLHTKGQAFIGCDVYKENGELYGTLFKVGTKMFSVKLKRQGYNEKSSHTVYYPLDCLTQIETRF